MRKGFLLKVIFLIIVLAGVTTVIFVTMCGSIEGTGRTQTFFGQFVIAGGPIVWFILLPMSFFTVYLAVEHSLTIRRKKLVPAGIGNRIVDIIRRYGPGQLASRISGQDDIVSVATVKALEQGRGDLFRMRSVLDESFQEQAWRYMRRIEWINLMGNVSPMVGLFGTVFGMIKLFNAIVLAGGQPQPAQLADGISVALVTTFWGLFIAIPALAIYGVFHNRIETLVNDAVVEAENIIPEIKRSLIKLKQQPAVRPVGASQPPIHEFKAGPLGTSAETLRPQK